MKKTIAAFVLGGVITAGAFSLSYALPITSAAEKNAPAKSTEEMADQCTEMMRNPEKMNMMKSMMPGSKTADSNTADIPEQCTQMMKDPSMQKMMDSMSSKDMPAGDMHSNHHQ